MEKYYIPELSEFYTGFKYEYRYFVGQNTTEYWKNGKIYNNCWTEWVSCEDPTDTDYGDFAKSSPYGGNLEDVKYREFRVKYLDREDIESCGWLNNINQTDIFQEFKHQEVEAYLWFFENGEDLNIEIQLQDTYFRGLIKNKSELIKLMKQLEIK